MLENSGARRGRPSAAKAATENTAGYRSGKLLRPPEAKPRAKPKAKAKPKPKAKPKTKSKPETKSKPKART
jgi:hypothetical protein